MPKIKIPKITHPLTVSEMRSAKYVNVALELTNQYIRKHAREIADAAEMQHNCHTALRAINRQRRR